MTRSYQSILLVRNEEEAARWMRKGKMCQAEGTGGSILGTAGAFCDEGEGWLAPVSLLAKPVKAATMSPP